MYKIEGTELPYVYYIGGENYQIKKSYCEYEDYAIINEIFYFIEIDESAIFLMFHI